MGRSRRGWGGVSDLFGGMDQRFAAPPQAYEDYFKAYSLAMFPGPERADVSYGGKSKCALVNLAHHSHHAPVCAGND